MVGATGYIGKFVVKELIRRGYDVVAFARERSGIGGKATKEETLKVRYYLRECWDMHGPAMETASASPCNGCIALSS